MTRKKIENVYSRANKDFEAGIKFAEESLFPESNNLLAEVYHIRATS